MLGPAEWREIAEALERLKGIRSEGSAGGAVDEDRRRAEDQVQFMVCAVRREEWILEAEAGEEGAGTDADAPRDGRE